MKLTTAPIEDGFVRIMMGNEVIAACREEDTNNVLEALQGKETNPNITALFQKWFEREWNDAVAVLKKYPDKIERIMLVKEYK